MRYIQRNKNGEVVGHFANQQSYATECVPDDHPDIVAWDKQRKMRATAGPHIGDIEKRLAALEKRLNTMEV